MTTRTDIQAFADNLALRVAHDGVAAHEAAVTDLANHAMRRGIAPLVVEILVDRLAPAIVRQRAFGLLARELAVSADARLERADTLAAVA